MAARWRIRPHDQVIVHRICETAKLPPIVAQILAARDLTQSTDIDSFLDLRLNQIPMPAELPGVSNACEIILNAVRTGERIAIYGDYDCDGIAATAILFGCLKRLGAQVSYFVPSRMDDGYGLNADRLADLQKQGHSLVVTVDCGIASVAEIDAARKIGLQIVVTDHHQVGERLPAADAIVHPCLPGSEYPFANLCGAGVAFKLAWALFQKQAQSDKLPLPMREFLFQALAFTAVATIADVVPLRHENRILVHHGLGKLKEFGGPGMNELMKVAKLDSAEQLSTEDIAFSIAPRLNATGRLGQAQLGVELLVTEDRDRARLLAEYIDNLNKSRDSLERSILRDAKKMVHDQYDPGRDAAFVLACRGWHLGVIGIVAGRMAEEYHRPVVVISLDAMESRPAVGSARTSGDLDLYGALKACDQHLLSFGGHRAAAGMKINPQSVDAFRLAFCEAVLQQTGADLPERELTIDAEAPLCQLTLDVVRQLDRLAPFGQGNPRPILCATGLQLLEAPRKMGSDGRHLAIQVQQDDTKLRAVGFGKAYWSESLLAGEGCQFDFAFKPVINEFRGIRRVELQLIDFRRTRLPAITGS